MATDWGDWTEADGIQAAHYVCTLIARDHAHTAQIATLTAERDAAVKARVESGNVEGYFP